MFCAIIIVPLGKCFVVDVFCVSAKMDVGAVVAAVVAVVAAVVVATL